MDVAVEQCEGVCVVRIAGRIDALSADDLSALLGAEIGDGHSRVVVDMSRVDYTSSAGLRVLLAALKDSRQNGGDFRMAGIQAGVFRVLDLSGFTCILKYFERVEEAVGSFAG
jgi:anti-sigma B factor antagonist